MKMIYVIIDHEGDIVCAAENETQANKIIAEQESGILFSVLIPYYEEKEEEENKN